VQEATGDQVAFLEKALPEHRRVGIGRDGGPGEHCAIYFKASRFEEIAGGTFWLEEPIDRPGGDSLLDLKRICTWARVRDRQTGRTLRIYNTHLYLTEAARLRAVRTLLAQLAQGDPADAVLLTADFNATPSAASRRLFAEAGFLDTAELAGRHADAKTLHLYGIPLRSIDGILVKPGWHVHQHRVLSVKPGTTWPSDHFGVLADVSVDAADAHP
jgi:endonuclease/exonuclease/phosphatase family metal-dependent hydrolase